MMFSSLSFSTKHLDSSNEQLTLKLIRRHLGLLKEQAQIHLLLWEIERQDRHTLKFNNLHSFWCLKLLNL